MKFGFKTANKTFTGGLKSIQSRKGDIAFIGYFIKDYETRDIEFSSPVYSDQLCVVVKKASRIPQFILPLIIFDRTLWMFLGFETILGKFLAAENPFNKFCFLNLQAQYWINYIFIS